mmetsp:Transcript_23695/g.51555  ORF Transcript_23695/g.51555 Transcript_23695/m.51555 type:complete len:171 (+) Transcript_23695:67-579(+)
MGSLRRSSGRIAVCVLGVVCLFLSLRDTSANPGPVKRERELAQNVFHHMNPKRNNGNRNGGNFRNAPIPARPLGPEKVRAMRRHFKFPLLKRARNDAARVKGVGTKWQDVVKSDTSNAGTGTEEQQQQKQKRKAMVPRQQVEGARIIISSSGCITARVRRRSHRIVLVII